VKSEPQALRNAQLARDAGADGVFLINHGIGSRDNLPRWKQLTGIYDHLKSRMPGFWMGINCLDLYPEDAFKCIPDVGGLWADNAGINEDAEEQEIPVEVDSSRQDRNILYFGGVAFKYQRPVLDLTKAAMLATKHMDVVTTSGKGTGWAADIKKIQKMKQAMGDFPLAIASGVTPENVTTYLPVADCFLVATGISRNFYEFDLAKTRQLINVVRKGH
jgi:predicted TIM-barrel enzyme